MNHVQCNDFTQDGRGGGADTRNVRRAELKLWECDPDCEPVNGSLFNKY